jgi:hypothetical protein
MVAIMVELNWQHKGIAMTEAAYINAQEYVYNYKKSRKQLIAWHMNEHDLSREQAERALKYVDNVCLEYELAIREYDTIHNKINKKDTSL